MSSPQKRAILNVHKTHALDTQQRIEEKEQELARVQKELEFLKSKKAHYETRIEEINQIPDEEL